jgi:hypothetical protein
MFNFGAVSCDGQLWTAHSLKSCWEEAIDSEREDRSPVDIAITAFQTRS